MSGARHGQLPHGQSPHGQSLHGQSPHGQSLHGQSPHGQSLHGQSPGAGAAVPAPDVPAPDVPAALVSAPDGSAAAARAAGTGSPGHTDRAADAAYPRGRDPAAESLPVMCATCRTCATDRPLTWSLQLTAGGQRWLCQQCTRHHLRSLEARLDEAWW